MVKNGHKRGKQLYKCVDCDRQFVGGQRLDPKTIEAEYVDGKQTLHQLAERHDVCVKTIWNILEGMRHKHKVSKDKDVVVLMDATYWGRKFGVVIFKDALRNKVLWYKYLRGRERVCDYVEGKDWLLDHGFHIWGIVCDGMRGLFEEFKRYPVQMCQYHMISIVRRYLTTKPDLEASRELLLLAVSLSKKGRREFTEELEAWHSRHLEVLNQRHTGSDGRSHFVRPRLRSAYLSLKRHLKWLWTYEDYTDRLIPKTNAGIESLNSRLKTILRVHSGITSRRRRLLIDNFIASHY